ncbi:acetyl-CoA carboxylase biotin carboxyl carrier protein subunit [Streptococcus mutans 15VF2]|uniref:acetyl-CoA carboxylase biotin carboxyl carrier protein n=1 Tax=Streptococcus mutans TaxID=1309 RepID=UPI0002B54F1A|nr:acetyl-CoA carboxylase biotin carboxyl carrier protein [Streptococcus mutans]EMB75336.1 acetyl-CoA carboxylase biotin carboxyl carrier protein subunit [Streptococcus mutans 15VF2]EMC52327.1 acetyl-CoA carboxylase biotin carboxyl carrier protein subunit [Streptococcus mutans S1B]
MNISEIKDLMAQFDTSSLREFSYKNGTDELSFSKNRQGSISSVQTVPVPVANSVSTVASVDAEAAPAISKNEESTAAAPVAETAEGEIVESPLVGVAYLASAPDKPAFISVGDSVKKGQTLLIIEAMKVMNEVPAPKDGVVTEILVANEEVVEFGKGLVRIK